MTLSVPDANAAAATSPARVAVIAIHGVADQKAGDTARAIAGLLVNAGAPTARYSEGVCDSFILQVPPLASIQGQAHGTGSTPATPTVRPVAKALHQSLRSDFHRDGWVAPGAGASAAPAGPVAPVAAVADAGLAFSDYLLFKAERNGAIDEAHEVTRIRTTRADAALPAPQQVDVYEMYWADLSRLSGALPRIVTELFTMVFRLSRLGRDTVDQARSAATATLPKDSRELGRWNRFADLQIAIDWAFASVLANLFLMLLMAGLVILALGAAIPAQAKIRIALVIALPTLALLWAGYRLLVGTSQRVLATIAAIALGWLAWQMPSHWLIGLSWLAVVGVLCDYGLRVADARFPAARASGLTLLAAMVLLVLYGVATDAAPHDLKSWVRAGMRVVEYALVAIVAWWAVAAVALLAWIYLGQRATRSSAAFRARSSVATGRLGLFVSIASFLAMTMALWALVTTLVEIGAAGIDYSPIIFKLTPAAIDAAVKAHPTIANLSTGVVFLYDRYAQSTQAFALVAGLTLLLVAYLVVMFFPSVLAEIRARVGTPQRLGRWLTAGYAQLDRIVTVLVFLSVLLACVVGALLLLARFDALPGGEIERWSAKVGEISESVLKPLVFGAAGLAAAMTAFGGVLSRYAPWLRAPLDIALDVDNHFREFPRKAIPRARIFSRYAALLEHVAAQGYDRIVIVAHSQGTVISAEVLRYLQHRAGCMPATDRGTALWSQLRDKVHLLTAGCPLRQLYASRFPDLYRWVLTAHAGRVGPLAADVGACRWVNAYTTGDYVGRWLWSDEKKLDEFGGATLYKAVLTGPGPGPTAVGTEHDVCLGSGAHTHYFETDQAVVGGWIDELIAR